jgi:hypothetical protein
VSEGEMYFFSSLANPKKNKKKLMEESREGEDLRKKTQNKKSHDPFPLKI